MNCELGKANAALQQDEFCLKNHDRGKSGI
jgi:hypothetical protein